MKTENYQADWIDIPQIGGTPLKILKSEEVTYSVGVVTGKFELAIGNNISNQINKMELLDAEKNYNY